ncbi:MAG: hypothetical protein Q4C78_05355 [Synergistaceae bacterium]|nr:hypothetical protein [Synergistaceae bacterium]
MSKVAVFDIGSNSVKLTIGELQNNKPVLLFDASTVTSLAKNFNETKLLTESSITQTIKAVKAFLDFAKKEGANTFITVGTMALREAKNANRFTQRLKEVTSLDLQIISGDDEARYSTNAVLSSIDGLTTGSVTIFDTGGGSTEVTKIKNGKPISSDSINIGAVTLTDKYLNADRIAHHIVANVIVKLIDKFKAQDLICDRLIGVGGNVSTQLCVALGLKRYNSSLIHGHILKKAEVERQIALYADSSLAERKKILHVAPKRASIILAGCCITHALMSACDQDELIVSDKSLRHALLFEKLLLKG